MSQTDKLISKFKSIPSNFTFDEVEKMLSAFGYEKNNKGNTSGSRVAFIRKSDNKKIMLHKPHNPKVLKKYAVRQLLDELINNGDISED